MSCNTCASAFTIFRKEKGCPSCGFSFCSKCLNNKVFLTKINSEAKVCAKCKTSGQQAFTKVDPPDAFIKRFQNTNPKNNEASNIVEQEIVNRLNKFKEECKEASSSNTQTEIEKRLKKLKKELPETTDEQIQEKLACLRGHSVAKSKPVQLIANVKSEQEQADELIKQYQEQTKIDVQYKDEFDNLVKDIEDRLQKLKSTGSSKPSTFTSSTVEDEEENVKAIIEKVKAEITLDNDDIEGQEELPFCEICNEDATRRCLGCKYLFCKRCFCEHRDDECNNYEVYKPLNNKSS